MACDRLPGNAEALAAIAAITAQPRSDMRDQFHEYRKTQARTAATPDDVRHHLRLISQRVGIAPILDMGQVAEHREALGHAR